MNAYELSKLMLDVTDCESSEYYQAGMMLKQQADQIKELERKHKEEYDYSEKLLKERDK